MRCSKADRSLRLSISLAHSFNEAVDDFLEERASAFLVVRPEQIGCARLNVHAVFRQLERLRFFNYLVEQSKRFLLKLLLNFLLAVLAL